MNFSGRQHATIELLGEITIDGKASKTHPFDRIFNHVARHDNVSPLCDSVDTVNGLLLRHWIPVRLHEMDAACCGEIEPSSALVIASHHAICFRSWQA
jgi:hypothetical protein